MIFLYALASGGVFLERFLNLMLSMKSCFFFKKIFLKYLRGRRVPPGFGKPWGDAAPP